MTNHNRISDIKMMKAVVCGAGSIGQRHIRNLRKIGVTDIMALRTNRGHFKSLPEDLHVSEVTEWDDVKAFQPDIALVTNPSSLHIQTAIKLLPLVRGIFIDKPVSHTIVGLEEFIREVQERRVCVFVGYNLPFHPLVQKLEEVLAGGEYGRPLSYQATAGHWLPDWHPYEDYRQSYTARKDLGGGVSLTLIHEVQLAETLFGPVEKTAGFFPHSKELPLDVDVQANLMFRHLHGAVSQIHLDFLQRRYHREGTINCTDGYLKYDFPGMILEGFPKGSDSSEILWNDPSYDPNDCYVKMMETFLEDVAMGQTSHDFDLSHAFHHLDIVHSCLEKGEAAGVSIASAKTHGT